MIGFFYISIQKTIQFADELFPQTVQNWFFFSKFSKNLTLISNIFILLIAFYYFFSFLSKFFDYQTNWLKRRRQKKREKWSNTKRLSSLQVLFTHACVSFAWLLRFERQNFLDIIRDVCFFRCVIYNEFVGKELFVVGSSIDVLLEAHIDELLEGWREFSEW